MTCPHCNNPYSAVIDSRAKGKGIKRRRLCMECRERFTTLEVPTEVTALYGPSRDEVNTVEGMI